MSLEKKNDVILASLGEYKVGVEIGRGSFATVYKGEANKTKTPVAIKSVLRAKLNKKLLENLVSEIDILKTMKHSHIVGLIDCQQTPTYFHLIMGYCALGDLSYFIRKKKQLANSLPLIASLFQRFPNPSGLGLNEVVVVHFLKQLGSALQFLRDRNLVHRDIKPQNLLLCPPCKSIEEFEEANFVGRWELPILKIADFGFAKILPSTSLAETLCGSPLYMAPEILRYEKYNAKADLWSVGAVLYEMSIGKPPFKANNHVELLQKIERSEDRISFPPNRDIPSEEVKSLIKALLKKNPVERMGFKEFFSDPLVFEMIDNYSEQHKSLDLSQLDERIYISEYITNDSTDNTNKLTNDTKIITNESNVQDYQTIVNRPVIERGRSSGNENPTNNNQRECSNLGLGNTTKNPIESTVRSLNNTKSASNPPSSISSSLAQTQRNPPSNNRKFDNIGKVQNQNLETMNNYSSNSNIDVNNRSNANGAHSLQSGLGSRFDSDSSSIGSEYVLIEKKTVQVNLFADELAVLPVKDTEQTSKSNKYSNKGRGTETTKSHPSKKQQHNSSIKSSTNPDSMQNITNDQNETSSVPEISIVDQMQIESEKNERKGIERKPSLMQNCRRFSLTYGSSPTGALVRALNMASARLLGPKLEDPQQEKLRLEYLNMSESHNKYFTNNEIVTFEIARDNDSLKGRSSSKVSRRTSSPSPLVSNQSSPSSSSQSHFTGGVQPPQQRELKQYEKLQNFNMLSNQYLPQSSQGKAVVNYDQNTLISVLEDLSVKARAICVFGDIKFSQILPIAGNDGERENNCGLRKSIFLGLAQEALMLFVKTLSLLGLAMDKASTWWTYHHHDKQMINSNINDLVQWIRNKFNETLDKAEYLRTQIDNASIAFEDAENLSSGTESGPESEKGTTTAEKLIFDRALEMARNAALDEMAKQDLDECRSSYITAIWMLEAILQVTTVSPGDDRANPTTPTYSEHPNTLSQDDRLIIQNLISNINGRLVALDTKINSILDNTNRKERSPMETQDLVA
ncbi:kinase-like protein [Nadsonia fulvescens var. elongata DSM 6958]|uniref:Serine/threonine-protein kinase ATG1 n=1 Tax=Nadsonia fulvescens var. elongata DSM 6958 TaxID=857566 RepID=A0A1E3PPL3_9ASCO|nr:kinase-like protein [Nadsonia fulvescens var. elongata DSM 6958]